MTWTIPTPEEQVQFLRNIQRLLAEGLFVASYKFALLHALADLAVLKGDDSGAPLDLDTKDIAEKFVELYWQQCRPFEIGGETTGPDPSAEHGQAGGDHLGRSSRPNRSTAARCSACNRSLPANGRSLVGEVDQTVRVMPLWKLQTVGDERLDFLYDNLDRGNDDHAEAWRGLLPAGVLRAAA